MIDVKHMLQEGRLEVRFTAPVTAADYENALVPAIDEAIAGSEHIRLLAIIEAEVSDFTLGAMLKDARMGLKHWNGFDRVAVVTGQKGVRHAMSAFSVFMPCPVMSFAPEDEEAARRWLSESLGSIHQTDLGGGVLHIRLLGKLDRAAYAGEAEDLDAFIRRNARFRLLLDLREFDGWQGLGAIGSHLGLVRGHLGQLDKAAIVGDAGWQRMAQAIGKRILGIDARYFEAGQFEEAKAWISAG